MLLVANQTEKLATGMHVTSGEPNRKLASGKCLPLAIVALANHTFASGKEFGFANSRLFPTSVCSFGRLSLAMENDIAR